MLALGSGSRRRCRRGQGDREGVPAQDQRYHPPHCALAICVCADKLRDVPNGRGLGLDSAASGGEGGAFRQPSRPLCRAKGRRRRQLRFRWMASNPGQEPLGTRPCVLRAGDYPPRKARHVARPSCTRILRPRCGQFGAAPLPKMNDGRGREKVHESPAPTLPGAPERQLTTEQETNDRASNDRRAWSHSDPFH
jgi:hypothetical protein